MAIAQRDPPPNAAAAAGKDPDGGVSPAAARNARDTYVQELRRLSGGDPTLPDLVARGVAYHHAGRHGTQYKTVGATQNHLYSSQDGYGRSLPGHITWEIPLLTLHPQACPTKNATSSRPPTRPAPSRCSQPRPRWRRASTCPRGASSSATPTSASRTTPSTPPSELCAVHLAQAAPALRPHYRTLLCSPPGLHSQPSKQKPCGCINHYPQVPPDVRACGASWH